MLIIVCTKPVYEQDSSTETNHSTIVGRMHVRHPETKAMHCMYVTDLTLIKQSLNAHKMKNINMFSIW
jgi:hypothetical protein